MGMSVPGPKKNTRKVPIRYCSPIAVGVAKYDRTVKTAGANTVAADVAAGRCSVDHHLMSDHNEEVELARFPFCLSSLC